MTEENATPDANASAPQEQTPSATPAEAPTLESLYNEYNVQPPEQTLPRHQPAPQPAPEPQPEQTPEAAIHQEITTFRQELAAERQRKATETDEADFNNAVANLGKESGLEGKDTVLRGFLIAKAQEDQRLRAIWEKRTNNPQAWEKAVKILATEVKSVFDVPNPQLEENQRAMEESQRAHTSSAPPAKSREEEMMRLNDAEFSQVWARMAGRG